MVVFLVDAVFPSRQEREEARSLKAFVWSQAVLRNE